MKRTNRLLATLLALALIASTLPLGVFAREAELERESIPLSSEASTPLTLTLGEKLPVDFASGEVKEISFTPASDGIYFFTSDSPADTYATLYDGEESLFESDDDGIDFNFGIQYSLKAGKTYTLKARFLNSEETGSFNVTAEKRNPASSVSFPPTSYFKTMEGINFFEMSLLFEGESAAVEEEKTVTADDPELLEHHYSIKKYGERELTLGFTAKKAGSTTVRVTTENGLTATATATVLPAVQITPNVTECHTVRADICGYSAEFTVAEKGIFQALLENFSDDGVSHSVDVVKKDTLEYISQGENGYELEPGTYLILFDFYDHASEFTFDLTVVERVPARAIEITNDSLSGMVGDSLTVYYRFLPDYAIAEGFTISSDNPAVADVSPEDPSEVLLLSAGTANVTITSENGLTDTMEVNVFDYPPAESIDISSFPLTGYVGMPMDLWVSFYPDDSRVEEITWSVSDPSGASVTTLPGESYNATASFSKEGTFTFTATSESDLTADYSVEVKSLSCLTNQAPLDVTIAENNTEYFKATVTESGWYRISTENVPRDSAVEMDLYDTSVEWLEASFDKPYLDAYLEAGTTYFCGVFFESGVTDGSFTVRAEKLLPMESFTLSPASVSVPYPATCTLEIVANPDNSAPEEMHYALSDPTLASVYDSDNKEVLLDTIYAGTLEITASSVENPEKTATARITITEPETLVLGTEKTGTTSTLLSNAFRFVPEESGVYRFSVSSESYLCYDFLNEHLDSIRYLPTMEDSFTEELEAGKVYYLTCIPDSPEDNGAAFSVTVTKPGPATELTIDLGNIHTRFVGDYDYPNFILGPEGCLDEQVNLTSSAPDVVRVYHENDYYELYFASPGTATLTATTEGGVSSSVEVTSLAVPVISLDTDTELPFFPCETYYSITKADFTAPESGSYTFIFSGAENVNFDINDTFSGGINKDEERHNFTLEKDETYHFVFHVDTTAAKPFGMKVVQTVDVASLEIVSPPKRLDYYKGFEDFTFSGLELKATLENGDELSYSYNTDYTLNGFDVDIQNLYTEGDYEKTVIFCDGVSTEFTFNVTESPVERIELVQGTAVSYIEHRDGEWVEDDSWFYYYTERPADAKVKIFYKNGTEKTVSVSANPDLHYTVDWSDDQDVTHWTVGSENRSTVSYLGATANLPITVLPDPVVSIEPAVGATVYEGANAYEAGGVYFYFLDCLKDVEIKINYADSTSKTVPLMSEKGSYFTYESDQESNPWTVGGTNYATVFYGNISCLVPVTVLPSPVERIELLTPPTAVYYYGDIDYGWMELEGYYLPSAHKFEGLSFRIHYTNGSHQDVAYEDLNGLTYEGLEIEAHPTEESPLKPGEFEVTLTYAGKSLTYDASLVESPVSALEILELPDSVREDDWSWPSFNGTKIKIVYANGSHKTVTFTKDNTEIDSRFEPVYSTLVDDSYMTVYLVASTWEWMVSYKGFERILEIPYDETDDFEIELISFDPEITGTKLKYHYKNGSEKEIVLGTCHATYSNPDSFSGLVEADGALAWFTFSDYSEEKGYIFFSYLNTDFVISTREEPGDVDGNDTVDMDDAIYLLFAINFPETYPLNQKADFDGSGVVDMDDAIYLLFHVNFSQEYPLH